MAAPQHWLFDAAVAFAVGVVAEVVGGASQQEQGAPPVSSPQEIRPNGYSPIWSHGRLHW